jgi:hypothetical protein
MHSVFLEVVLNKDLDPFGTGWIKIWSLTNDSCNMYICVFRKVLATWHILKQSSKSKTFIFACTVFVCISFCPSLTNQEPRSGILWNVFRMKFIEICLCVGSQTLYIKRFACFFGFLWELGIYVTEKCSEKNRCKTLNKYNTTFL